MNDTDVRKTADYEREILPHMNDVYRFALSLTGNVADAEDVTQDTFLRAWRSWHTYQPGSEPRRWLFTIARNVVRQRAGRPQHVELDAIEGDSETIAAVLQHSDLMQDDGARAEAILVVESIDEAISQLPEPFRSAVVLVDVEDQSYQDAAEILDVPVGTVRSRLFRGRRMLQRTLAIHARDAGITADGAP